MSSRVRLNCIQVIILGTSNVEDIELLTTMPKISILIATYNRANLLSGAIESVCKQTFQDWEMIIADDASTDDTMRVIIEWQDREPRIKYVRNESNIGIARNSNSGLWQARGEYIAILDDDDRWIDPEKLQKQVKFLDNNSAYVAIGGGVIVVDGEGHELFRYFKPQTDKKIHNKMLFDNPMANSTTMFRKSAAEKVGWYDESLRYATDRDFWLKMGAIGKLYNMPEYWATYLMAGQNTSIVKIREHLRSSLTIMKRYRVQYPHYWLAVVMNRVQYLYSFLPLVVRQSVHVFLARGKRFIFR